MSRPKTESFLSKTSILDTMRPEDLREFRRRMKLYKVRKGKELFREGAYPRAVYIIKRGKVKLYQRNQNGAETIVHIHTTGEIFGYRPLLCGEKYTYGAETLENGAIYRLSAKDFLMALSESAGLTNVILRALSHEFSILVRKISDFAQRSVKERTALSLLLLKEKYRNPSDKGPTEITLSRHDLAAFVGTTIETIARIIRRLREDQVIQTKGRKIIIKDEEALLRLAD